MSFEEIKKKYRELVSPEIFAHNVRVAEFVEQYAKDVSVDVEKAKIAALVHDVVFDRTPELLDLAKKHNLTPLPIEEKAPILLHGPVAAEMIKEIFKIDDPDIYQAVYYHTTGHAEATELDKLIFLADSIEPGGGKVGHGTGRKVFMETQNLDKACLAYLKEQIPFQISQGWALHSNMVDFYNHLVWQS